MFGFEPIVVANVALACVVGWFVAKELYAFILRRNANREKVGVIVDGMTRIGVPAKFTKLLKAYEQGDYPELKSEVKRLAQLFTGDPIEVRKWFVELLVGIAKNVEGRKMLDDAILEAAK